LFLKEARNWNAFDDILKSRKKITATRKESFSSHKSALSRLSGSSCTTSPSLAEKQGMAIFFVPSCILQFHSAHYGQRMFKIFQ